MKPNKAIWVLAVIMLSALLTASIIGCKEKKANVERSTSTSSEDYSEQTNEKWYDDEQESDDEPGDPDEEPNMPGEDPNVGPNLPEQEPNEPPEEPNEQWL